MSVHSLLEVVLEYSRNPVEAQSEQPTVLSSISVATSVDKAAL